MSAPEHLQSHANNTDSNAMAEVASPGSFRFNITSPPLSRRKRRFDDDQDAWFDERDTKRRSTTLHSLPIRLSPSRPNVSTSPASFSLFTSIYQQPPTPVDTSDDESLGQQTKDDEPWCLSKQDSQPQSDGSSSSTRAQCGDTNADVDMDLTAPLTTQPRIRRARSNDIVPPERDSNLLGAMDMFARERVPTPISSHFDNRVSELPNVPRHQFPPLRTNLSPMIEQESWISRDGLPSPVEDQDMDMVMDRDDASKGDYFGRYTLDGHSSPSGRARSGRLHMGFLNDCEKCIQKVPGHYSHILWT
jgi:hypothetical protein